MAIQTDPNLAEVSLDTTDTDAINAAVDTALNTAIPETNTADSVNDVLLDQLKPAIGYVDHLYAVTDGAGAFPASCVDASMLAKVLSKVTNGDTSSYNNTTDSLEAIADGVAAIPTTAMRGTDNAALASVLGALDAVAATGAVSDAKVAMAYLKQLVTDLITVDGVVDGIASATTAGKLQIVSTTESLNQAASTYDLLTGTTQAVVLEKLNFKLPTGNVGGALTSISVQTDDATPGVIISAVNGAVANLLTEADLSWTGSLVINVGTKIQLTIAGGAHGSAYAVTVVAQSRAVVSGGYLAVSA
jgi:hypothetical protein